MDEPKQIMQHGWLKYSLGKKGRKKEHGILSKSLPCSVSVCARECRSIRTYKVNMFGMDGIVVLLP